MRPWFDRETIVCLIVLACILAASIGYMAAVDHSVKNIQLTGGFSASQPAQGR